MPVAVDGSSPPRALITTGTSLSTAAFNPPANSVILVGLTADHGVNLDPTLTVADNAAGGALTWNLIAVRRQQDAGSGHAGKVGLYYAVCLTARTGLVVTGTTSVSNQVTMLARVLTGVDLTTPIGSVLASSSTANPLVTTGVTPGLADGMMWFTANDSVGAGGGPTAQPSASDATAWDPYYDGNSNFAGAMGYKPILSLSPITFSLTGVGDTSIGWNYVVVEVRAAAGGVVPESVRYSSAMADMMPY